ncbi:PREDICTED: ectopic P granules protein 5 homolog [Nicrophorus vespilloides]|uniref:Ectopic P granules protein 5 homolog n=1 Tax=Nicrophorus vespilloides TaxID=110193 RepID=A0ABM1MM24_NICVS|nr:PREDICTED: ectopic P granules protein 5 homolog [Nicrophorus vespilloides]
MEKEKPQAKQRKKNKTKAREAIEDVVASCSKTEDILPNDTQVEVEEVAEAILHNDVITTDKPIVKEDCNDLKDTISTELDESCKDKITFSVEGSVSNGELHNEITVNQNEIEEKSAKEKLLISKTVVNHPVTNYKDLKQQLKELHIIETNVESKIAVINKIKPFTESQLSALYANSELAAVKQFTDEFIEAELKGLAANKHTLHELLKSYLQVRSKVQANFLEIKQLRHDYQEAQNQLWTLSNSVAHKRGVCMDGVSVMATHTFTTAKMHHNTYQSIIRMQNKLRELTNETHVLYSYTAEVLRLQIHLYIHNIKASTMSMCNLSQNSPICLSMQQPPEHMMPYLQDLRLCISILFSYLRKLIRDTEFIKQIRQWLSELVCVLLRLACWQDHLFILNHILRCQPGIGSWGAQYIQFPLVDFIESPFSNYEINHILSMLSVILLPVNERELFLKEVSQLSDEPTETLWVIVDSDGEEDEDSTGVALRENDLVALLNQLPLDNLFRAVLLINRRDNEDFYDVSNLTENHILRFFAFSTTILKLFHQGLKSYDQLRYIQFCKRLSRLIRHVVQYATDQWEIYLTYKKSEDMAMMDRLQVEYDAFFLRAINYLYNAEKLGAWQFLAVIPYGIISISTLWKIFYFLHNSDSSAEDILNPTNNINYMDKLWDKSLREQFEEKIISLADDECYYLLNTFANMALSRNEDDMKFINLATMDLLQVGFVSQVTQESCSKNARILLTHITSKYSNLLSNILKAVKDNISAIQSYSLYLYEELPISAWKLTDADLEIISNLLLNNNINSVESKLARMILSRLNWELVEDGKLFLPYSFHCKIATLIVNAVALDQGYLHWAWQTAFRLRLHISDKGFTNFQNVKDIEYYDAISRGVRNQDPLSCFLSVLITSWGHLIPLVCSKGFDQLLFLQTHQKHEAVLFALNQIVPLFINCQESVINLEKFQMIILGLLNADRTYINIAKSLVTVQNTILEQFGNMIESQIANYSWYGVESPRYIVRLWINSLVSVPNWNRDYGVMYLLDIMIRASLSFSDTLDVIVSILKELLQCATPQEQTNSIASLFKWVSQSNSQNTLLINSSLSSCPYLSYIMFRIEFEERERSTGLWNEILLQLKNQKGKVNVDNAIRKAANKLKLPSFSSGSLSIFRWAQQILDTPIHHPIIVLLWQKFFCLYLYRVPMCGTVEGGCVGDKFFEGMINYNFLQRLKKCLQETVAHYKKIVSESRFEELPAVKQLFYQSNLNLFTAYSLWLEEPRLQDASLYIPGLPPQYEPVLLNLIMQCNDAQWFTYVDHDVIKEHQIACIKTWRCANYRERKNINKPLLNIGSNYEGDDPVQRILRRLHSYDTPKSAPSITITKSLLANIQWQDKRSMFSSLNVFIKTIQDFAHNHALQVSEHKALDSGYQERVPQLYRSYINKIKKSVPCTGSNKTVNCSGAAVILVESQEAAINEHIDMQIQSNRKDHEVLIAKFLQVPSQSLCLASINLQNGISLLQTQREMHAEYSALGVELFYYILSLLNEETSNYLPSKKLFTECMERLGQIHIYGIESETPTLLNKILKEPTNGMYLVTHFCPINLGTANFLLMYSMISKRCAQRYDLWYSLLSKFDVTHWLLKNQPKLSEIVQLQDIIFQALIQFGQEPESIVVHEHYRRHLIQIFEFQFPEHYGEVLVRLLKASTGADADSISVSVWLDVLNSLSKPLVWEIGGNKRDKLREYATSQKKLHYQEILETALLLSRHYTNDRFQYGLYGLYPKTRNFVDVIALLLGTTGHALIISALETHQGLLGDKICEIIWPQLRDLFAPWVLPYWTNNMKENMANWIQQLTDDRTVLLPWIPANAPFAQKIVDMFFECLLFLVQTLPANNILSYVWQWYVSNFAHVAVKDHILNVIHHSLINLPWNKFWPSIPDLEFMLKLVDQYVPECHTFLGHIFIEIPWRPWIYTLNENVTAITAKARIYHCLLNILVKLSNEPNMRNNYEDRLKPLLMQAETFDWSILETNSVQQALDWYVMSCDPMILFKRDSLDLDYRIIQFLRTVCCYTVALNHYDQKVREKRHIFVRSYMKLVVVFTNRYKNIIPTKEVDLVNVIKSQLNDMENIVNVEEDMNLILSEILAVLNQSCLKKFMIECFIQWIASREGDAMAIKSTLMVLGHSVMDPEIVSILYESCIHTYFENNVSNMDKTSWKELSKCLKFNTLKQSVLTDVLIVNGSIFTMHVLLLQKIDSSKPLLNLSLQWLQSIKVTSNIEAKMPLIWSDILDMCFESLKTNEAATATALYKFAKCLLQISEQKDGMKWGVLLNVIGIGKQNEVTINFKFVCRAVGGYVLAQLPESKGKSQTVRSTPNSPCTVGQPGGNAEVSKMLLKLDFGQSQGKIKECAEGVLRQIQDPANSLHNVKDFLNNILQQFYTYSYLKEMD